MTELQTLAKQFLAGEPVFVPVPYLKHEQVTTALHGLIDFETLVPVEERERWALWLPRAGEDPTPDDGVIRRDTGEHDRKLFAHVRRGLVRNLEQNGVVIPDPLLTWILACHEVRETCRAVAFAFLEELDAIAPGYSFAERMRTAEASPNTCLVRVVKYDDAFTGYTESHTDRNGLTFSLGASAPGFYIEQGGKRVHPQNVPGKALVFPGQHFERVSGGMVKALRHGSEPAVGSSRCALVFFAYLAP